MFFTPQVNIYSTDVVRSMEFYQRFGFEEIFRTPREGTPLHVELQLDGFTLGIGAVTSAIEDHGLDIDLSKPGRGMEVTVWTDDTDAAFAKLVAEGARPLVEPRDFLGYLRVAWVADPDDNPVGLVQRRN